MVARFEDGAGLAEASAVETALGRALAVVATLWFACVAFWEIAAPFGPGHDALSSVIGVAGENMLRFHTLVPVTELPLGNLTAADANCQHPFGVYWTTALFLSLLGHHDFVCRLPAALLSSLTPPLLYALGRALLRPLAGGLAALAFALTPVALCYANLNGWGVPLGAASCLMCLGYVRFRQTVRRRWMLVCLGALGYALNTDFPAYVCAIGLLALLHWRTFLRGRSLQELAFRRHATLFAWGVVISALISLSYALAFQRLGKLPEFLLSEVSKAANPKRVATASSDAARYTLLLLFTPLTLALGKVASVASVLRALLKRRELEWVPCVLLATAACQYLLFAARAPSQSYWLQAFAPAFALCFGGLTTSALELATRLLSHFGRPSARALERLTFAMFGMASLLPLASARDALRTLVYVRKTGGRFDAGKGVIQADRDKIAALEFLKKQSAPGNVVALNLNMKRADWMSWALERPIVIDGASTFDADPRFNVVDGRYAEGTQLHANSGHGRPRVVGPFWIFERAGQTALPIEGFSIEPREPGLLERLFAYANHAPEEVAADAFQSWEIRDLMGQAPNPEPTAEPRTFEQLRIAHNLAFRRGDETAARHFRERWLAGADARPRTVYEDGSVLLATRFESHAADLLSVYFESSGPDDQRFSIRARVEARPTASLVPSDPNEWEVGLPTRIPRNLWRPGYLYSATTEILHRPGRERFTGSWVNTGDNLPLRAKGKAKPVTLLVME